MSEFRVCLHCGNNPCTEAISEVKRFRVTLKFDIEAMTAQEADEIVQEDPSSSTYEALDGISVEIEERKP